MVTIEPESQTKFVLAELLQKAMSSQISQQERKNVDTELKKLGMISMTQHVRDLCEIISTDQIPNESAQKDQAVIHLKNYLQLTLAPLNKSWSDSSKVPAGSQTILYEDLIQCAESICQLIMGTPMADFRRNNVQISLEILLFSAQRMLANQRKKVRQSKQMKAAQAQQKNLIVELF